MGKAGTRHPTRNKTDPPLSTDCSRACTDGVAVVLLKISGRAIAILIRSRPARLATSRLDQFLNVGWASSSTCTFCLDLDRVVFRIPQTALAMDRIHLLLGFKGRKRSLLRHDHVFPFSENVLSAIEPPATRHCGGT